MLYPIQHTTYCGNIAAMSCAVWNNISRKFMADKTAIAISL